MAARRTLSPEVSDLLKGVLARAFTKEDAARALVALEDQAQEPTTAAALRRALAAVPVLTLYVPMPLKGASVKKIALWCRKEFGQDLLLEIGVDPAAAGGCLFAWAGVLHDFSLTHFLHKAEDAYAERLAELASAPLTAP